MSISRKSTFRILLPVASGIGLILYFMLKEPSESPELTAAKQALETRDFRQASIHLEKHLAEKPSDLAARLLAAQTARRERYYFNAAEHLQAYEQMGGRKDDVTMERRLTRAQEGDLREAKSLLREGRHRSNVRDAPLVIEAVVEGTLRVYLPEDTLKPLTVSKGDLVPTPDDLIESIELWLQVRGGRADQAQGYVWRGRANRVAGLYPQSVADFRKALELAPDHFEARWLLLFTISQEAPQECLEHLRFLHERQPENQQVALKLATVLRGLGRLLEAKSLLDSIIAQNPNSFDALLERGYVCMDEQNPEESERWLRMALRIAPDVGAANLALGRCLQIAGKTAEATQYLQIFERIEAQSKRAEKDAVLKN